MHRLSIDLMARRIHSKLLAGCTAFALLVTPTLSQSIPIGDQHVGTFRIERPAYAGSLPTTILIRGNLPVPDLLFEPSAGEQFPLAVLNPNGTYAPTQIESVTRYSGPSPDCSIVEVIAEVTPWDPWTSGLKEYKVVLTDNNANTYSRPTETQIHEILREKTSVGSTVGSVLRDQESIIILTEDPLGNQYIAYPLSDLTGGGSLPNVTYVNGTDRFGDLQTTATSFSQQIPYPSHVSNTYPHMFGIHSIFDVQKNSGALGMDLIISNGTSDYTGTTDTLDDGLGYIAFKSIKLLLRQPSTGQPTLIAHQMMEDQFENLGGTPTSMTINGRNYDAFDIVEAFGSEQGNHMMDALGQFHRRLILSEKNSGESTPEEEALIQLRFGGQGFATKGFDPNGLELWSWFNASTALFFPQNDRLPTLDYSSSTPFSSYSGLTDLRSTLSDWRIHLEDTVAGVGSPGGSQGPIEFDSSITLPVGWANPLGKKDVNTGSGVEIAFTEGGRMLAAASLDGVLYEAMKFRLKADRQPNFAFRTNGRSEIESDYLAATVNNTAGFPYYLEREFTFSSNRKPNNFYPSGTSYVSASGTTYLPPTQFSAYAGVTFHADWELHTNSNSGMKYADHSHITRFLLPALALGYGVNDPLSKAYVSFYAELALLAMPNKPTTDYITGWAYARTDSVYRLLKHSAGHNQVGSPDIASRPLGWTLQMVSAAYAFAPSGTRTRLGSWLEIAANVLVEEQIAGQDENGLDVGSFGAMHETKYYHQYCTNPVDLNPPHVTPPEIDVPAPLIDAPTSRSNWEAMVLANGLLSVLNSYAPPGSTFGSDLYQALTLEYSFFDSPVLWNSALNSHYVVSPISSSDDVLDKNAFSNVATGHPSDEVWPSSIHLASTDSGWLFFSVLLDPTSPPPRLPIDLDSLQLDCSSNDNAYYPGDPTMGGYSGQPSASSRTVDHYFLHAYAQAEVFTALPGYETRAIECLFNSDYGSGGAYSTWTIKQLMEGLVDPTDANLVDAYRWSNCFSYLANK